MVRASLILALIAAASGCSSKADVTGKVTADGKAVTSGGIVLSPLSADGVAASARPGMADVGADGTFKLELELLGSGANRYAVRYTPTQAVTNKSFKDGVIPFSGYVPKQTEVEIKPGANAVSIELMPKKNTAK